jgi:hypothetical protein
MMTKQELIQGLAEWCGDKGCGEAVLEPYGQRDADDLKPRMTFNLIESR